MATLLAGRGHAPDKDKKDDKKKDDESKPKDEGIGAGTDGVIGVAPKAQILTASTWLGTPNPSGGGVDEQIPAAVRWAVDNGAQVINMSLTSSSTSWPESWDAAFLYAEQHDVVVVAAAGNRAGGHRTVRCSRHHSRGPDRGGPEPRRRSQPGRIGPEHRHWRRGAGRRPGGWTARRPLCRLVGTSGATPLVSGVAALIRSKYPDMSAAQVINRIISTAKDSGVPGHDPIYGYGVLNAEAALNAEVPEVQPTRSARLPSGSPCTAAARSLRRNRSLRCSRRPWPRTFRNRPPRWRFHRVPKTGTAGHPGLLVRRADRRCPDVGRCPDSPGAPGRGGETGRRRRGHGFHPADSGRERQAGQALIHALPATS